MYFFRIVLSLLLLSVSVDKPVEREMFISPVKIPLALSASFGEIRTDHFHSGLDIKTQGVTGKEIVAAARGYVYRISISPGGFGKAIYIRHPQGYSTVYGHIDKFIPEIEEYVTARQYEEKTFMITLWPSKEKFRFEQGDLIAYSGNSGSSSGPHLHYEIRKSDDEVPVNPLLFDFGVRDDIKPVIEKLVIYRAGENTLINSRNSNLRLNVAGRNGRYYIPPGTPIKINGLAGFGIKAYDQFSDSYNKCSVYSIELKIDSSTVYHYIMDAFSFNESRYVNSHIDYETFIKENIYIERAFRLPNDKLSTYRKLVDDGIIDFNDGQNHRMEIIVTDIHKNESRLTFNVASTKENVMLTSGNEEAEARDVVMMPYGRNNRFTARDVIVNIPAGTLYDTLYFTFGRESGNTSMFSDIFQIHDRYTPLHRSYTLSIRPSSVQGINTSKLLVVQTNGTNQRTPLASRWENGYLVTSPSTFGKFYIGIDTVSPVISTNGYKQGADLSGRSELRLRITDNFSGIKKYEPLIDGKWALFEYDQKNNALVYRFDHSRITSGNRHSLSISVTDNMNNVSNLNWEFIW